jgi:hypothetical protein
MSNYAYSPLVHSTHFVGLASAVTAASLSEQIKDDDSRRIFWLKHVIPVLTQQFLDELLRKKRIKFTFPGLDIVHSPEDEADDAHNPFNTAYYQDFPHYCASNRIQARYVPWQFRFVLHPSLHPLLESPAEYLSSLSKDIFEKSGWSFCVMDDGFCMAPLWLDKELSDLSYVYLSWMEARKPSSRISFDFVGIPLLPCGIRYPLLPSDGEVDAVDPPALQRLAAAPILQ